MKTKTFLRIVITNVKTHNAITITANREEIWNKTEDGDGFNINLLEKEDRKFFERIKSHIQDEDSCSVSFRVISKKWPNIVVSSNDEMNNKLPMDIIYLEIVDENQKRYDDIIITKGIYKRKPK